MGQVLFFYKEHFMKRKEKETISSIFEELGFSIDLQDECIDFYQYTPCGEDWHMSVSYDGTLISFLSEFLELETYFDPDEEALLWAHSLGKNGVPNSLQALLDDAKWKQVQLKELAKEFSKIV